MDTLQRPIGSGFTAASTTADVLRGIDLSGKTGIVTGGYSGLGCETVLALRSVGSRVIVPARDIERAADALKTIKGVESRPMDLLVPASIDGFANSFLSQGTPLNILVNSAGIMAVPERTLDGRGYELHFAANHLGHFQLSLRLLPALERANGARVVSVSSWGHHFSPVHFDDPNYKNRPIRPLGSAWPIEDRQYLVCRRTGSAWQGPRDSCFFPASRYPRHFRRAGTGTRSSVRTETLSATQRALMPQLGCHVPWIVLPA